MKIETGCALLCEGRADKKFFQKMADHKGTSDLVTAFCPKDVGQIADGKDKFPGALDGLETQSSVRAVFVAADCDDDPEASLERTRQALQSAGYPAPKSAGVLAGDAAPFAAILMVPGDDAKGCLETLLYAAAVDKYAGADDCVSEFEACVNPDWKEQKLAKLRFHLVLAAYCEKNPGCSAAHIWRSNTEFLPIESPHFAGLGDQLSDLSTQLRGRL